MTKIAHRNEILFRAPTRVGLLADVAEKLHANGVNMLGIRAYDEGEEGVFLIHTDDNRAAATAIQTLDEGAVETVPVISATVPNVPGQLAAIARALSNAEVNVTHIHATSTTSPMAELVLQTDDNVAALAAMERVKA